METRMATEEGVAGVGVGGVAAAACMVRTMRQIWWMCVYIRGLHMSGDVFAYAYASHTRTHVYMHRQRDTQTHRHTDTQTHRQKDTDTDTQIHVDTRHTHTHTHTCTRARHTRKCANDACAFLQKMARTKKDRNDARACARSERRVIAREGRDTARNTRPFQDPQTQAHTCTQIIYSHLLT